MVELATARRDPNSAPYADVLLNVGKPSLSGTSDMPVVDLAKPGQGNDGELTQAPPPAGENVAADAVDTEGEASQASDTSETTGGEGDGSPKEAGEGKDATPAWVKAQLSRERNRRQAVEANLQKLQSQFETVLEHLNKITPKPSEPQRPQRDSFDTPEAYDEALEAYAGSRAKEQALAEARAQQLRQEQASAVERIASAYKQRADAFAETHPDYFDLVNADDAGFTLPMTAAIAETEDGPAVAYHLANHPEMIERIAKLSDAAQAAEIGRLAAKLTAPPPAPKPAPIKTLTGRATDTAEREAEPSMEQWAAMRAAKK